MSRRKKVHFDLKKLLQRAEEAYTKSQVNVTWYLMEQGQEQFAPRRPMHPDSWPAFNYRVWV